MSAPTDTETFTIHGITGVDVSLPIAGPGSRSFAFIIDWHIRLVLALAWFFAAAMIEFGTLQLIGAKENPTAVFVVLVVPLVIYFLYHPILELLMRGQSPGKRMAGVRIVTLAGGAPSAGAVLIRNVFRLIDSLPALYLLGLLMCFFTAQRVRIGDLAAGTVLVVDERVLASHLERTAVHAESGMDLAVQELAQQLLERWSELEPDRRSTIGRALITKAQGRAAASAEAPSAEALSEEALHQALVRLAQGTSPS